MNLTEIEEALISLIFIHKRIIKINGAKGDCFESHNILHGHSICFNFDPFGEIKSLPRKLDCLGDILHIVLIIHPDIYGKR